MKEKATIIIPAYNEQQRIENTLKALRTVQYRVGFVWELIVVDDGSSDRTAEKAESMADRVIRLPANAGKGGALEKGWKEASFDTVVFLDADLGESAVHVPLLLEPVLAGILDMSVAKLPAPDKKGGIGLAKRLAAYGISRLSGFQPEAPLSGQRAMRKTLLRSLPPLSGGFGIEVGLTIEAVRKGYRVGEVEVPFRHRETGRDFRGFFHRGRQFVAVGSILFQKWRHEP